MSQKSKYTVRGVITILTLFFDGWLMYFCPFWVEGHLRREDAPWQSPPARLALTVYFGILALMLIADFFLFFRYWRLPKSFWIAPGFTIMIIAGCLITGLANGTAPNTTIDSTGGGFHYRVEVWFDDAGGGERFKRWKSKEPYDGKAFPWDLNYDVDSIWVTK